MSGAEFVRSAVSAIPVEPDKDEARQLLTDELSKPAYQEARPTPFDLAAKAVGDWISSILNGAGDAGGTIGLVVIIALIAAVLVVAFLVFGRPRLERRRRSTASLFGDDDQRTADQIRAAARSAGDAGDFDLAVAEAFRALARGLDERTLVDLHPGTTATGFARTAGHVFPSENGAFVDAARVFDIVRYLGGHGTAEAYASIARLDETVAALRPELDRAGMTP